MLYTAEQKRDNLGVLSELLIALPEDYVGFDMEDFFSAKAIKAKIAFDTTREFDEAVRKEAEEVANKYARENGGVAKCGAVACAVGHGPTAGFLAVASDFTLDMKMDWWKYTRRVFLDRTGSTFEWMFGGQWSLIDNTAQGAGRRIRYYLEHGVPAEFVDEDGYEVFNESLVALYADA
jgi:hypothetical protein